MTRLPTSTVLSRTINVLESTLLAYCPEWAFIASWKDEPLSVQPAAISSRISRLGQAVARYGLVVVLAWIGVGKFVKMEAHVLIEHNPLMSWIYLVLSHSAVATALGTAEILAAVLIALHRVWPLLSAVGSAMAVVLFVGTLSFLFTTPGLVVGHAGPIPILGALPGQFLLKDLVLIGVAIWTLGDALDGRRVPPAAKQSSGG